MAPCSVSSYFSVDRRLFGSLMLKQALHPSKSRPQIHELGIKFVHVSHRRRLPSVTGRGIISQFADLLLLPRGTVYYIRCPARGTASSG